MASLIDPPISLKISRMQDRVRWQTPTIKGQHIDQTGLSLEDGHAQDDAFSFLVIGDSGSGSHGDHNPQRRIAEQMVPHLQDCRFLLHTGDVVYQVGSREQYPDNFISPYREWLVGGENHGAIAYNGMVFQHPFLTVLGNHDYYNLPLLYRLTARMIRPIKQLLGVQLRSNLGYSGSNVGDTYARAFMDCLDNLSETQLQDHLAQHYTATTRSGRCLTYRPGHFTRLPNRYYRFNYGGIDFFGLDSSTFNAPSTLASAQNPTAHRQKLAAQKKAIADEKEHVLQEFMALERTGEHAAERRDDLRAKLEQLEEVELDLAKQLNPSTFEDVDVDQLTWLREQLIASWRDPDVRGRILFFHHPPYVTEATKASQGQTLAVRHHLRWVLDGVALALGHDRPKHSNGQFHPLVNLVLCGHAHCFEHLKTADTGFGDAHINWLVCGGSGLSLRRQQEQGPELYETFPQANQELEDRRLVAKSQQFIGLTGHKTERRRPYSYLRIDVQPGKNPQFMVHLHVSERYHQAWKDYTLDPLVL